MTKVLIAEDNRSIVGLYQVYLRRVGLTNITKVYTPQAEKAALDSEHYDIVIQDTDAGTLGSFPIERAVEEAGAVILTTGGQQETAQKLAVENEHVYCVFKPETSGIMKVCREILTKTKKKAEAMASAMA